MIIRNLDVVYTVIQVESSNSRYDSFLCKKDDSDADYRIFRVKNPMLVKSLAEFFYEQARKEQFEDFLETFTEDGYLYAVVAVHQEKLLKERLEEEKPGLEERLSIGADVLRKLLLYQMPPYFSAHCLLAEQILADASGEVIFQCTLNDVENWMKYTRTDFSQALLLCFKMLFAPELKRKAELPILIFLHKLEQGFYVDDLEIYKAYLEAMRDSLALSEAVKNENHTWPFRAWKKVRKCFKPLKKMAAVLILIGVICFVCYELFVPKKSNGKRDTDIRYIGTVTIEEGEEE